MRHFWTYLGSPVRTKLPGADSIPIGNDQGLGDPLKWRKTGTRSPLFPYDKACPAQPTA